MTRSSGSMAPPLLERASNDNEAAVDLGQGVSFLCHGCFSASVSVVPCERGHCQGTMRYCSVSCRKSSACTSLHSERHCRFLGQLLTIKNAQISMANEPFAEYISTATGRPTATYRSGSEQCKLSTSGGSSTSSFRPISGGIRTMCQVGDPVEVVQFPHQMDAGGSLLVRHNQGTKEKLLLVDVEALETWTDPDTHSQNLRLLQASNHLWLRGIAFWINDGAYREAVSCFRESLQIFDWPDNNSDPASTQKLFWEATLQPSPLATEPERTIVARRSHFLAMCLNDDSSHGDIDEVRRWFIRSLVSLPISSTTTRQHQLAAQPFLCGEELGLTYQEAGNMTRNMTLAHAVATWSIQRHDIMEHDDTKSYWVDPYQRPGYTYWTEKRRLYNSPILDPINFTWCNKLEQHFDVIRNEFLDLIHTSSEKNKDADSSSVKHPWHWPAVGSGEHRDSGQHDGQVVNKAGDWRELVLFGSGATLSHAPKTRALLRKHVPDAVSLAEAGAGEVIFSVLSPHTRIAPHCASTNIRYTAHLGLKVPKTGKLDSDRLQCGIRIGKEWRSWAEGKFLVFDDSFEHEVVNDTDEVRAVLLVRFWHSAFSRESDRRSALQQISNQRQLAEQVRHIPPFPPEHVRAESRCYGSNSDLPHESNSVCPSCSRFGHEHVRLVSTGTDKPTGERANNQSDVHFTCTCGYPIL